MLIYNYDDNTPHVDYWLTPGQCFQHHKKYPKMLKFFVLLNPHRVACCPS